ncbi:MAG: nucleotide exchange factor GrpE [Bacilli bacterium]|nr:nucleotide exchange factor GrpE [Bacilli bacterium]
MRKKKEEEKENVELLEETKELEQDTKLNEEMLKLENEINTLTEENKSLLEKVKLSQAELINYRRRKDEEVENLLKYANQSIITEILPVIDNFERAINKEEDLSDELKKYLVGFKMIHKNLYDILKKYGVEEINRVGQIFDPNQEQALLVENDSSKNDDIVLEVLLKGYKLKDRVIRPASVKINQK